MSNNDDLKKEEYKTLREELLQNKRYIFERPLLIITAGSVALVQLLDQPLIAFLPPILIILLNINLAFTFNRLRSTTRIAAYIAVVLEPNSSVPWLGWENSLRKYRIWVNTKNKVLKKELLNIKIKKMAYPGKALFFHSTYNLHIISVAVATMLSITFMALNPSWIAFIGFAGSFLSSGLFAYNCIRHYYPKDIRAWLETEMATWAISLDLSMNSIDQSESNPTD